MQMAATSTGRVREQLQHAILEGVLKPGERLRAEALAQRYGTSRTPVREALLQLEAQGLVEVEPNRGAVVRAFERADLLESLRGAGAARARRRRAGRAPNPPRGPRPESHRRTSTASRPCAKTAPTSTG